MTDTKGTGVLNTIFNGYEPYKGDIQYRKQGSLIAFESGESITYGLFNAQERGDPVHRTWRKSICRYGYRPDRQGRRYRDSMSAKPRS